MHPVSTAFLNGFLSEHKHNNRYNQGKRIKIIDELFSCQRFNVVHKGGSAGAQKFIYMVL